MPLPKIVIYLSIENLFIVNRGLVDAICVTRYTTRSNGGVLFFRFFFESDFNNFDGPILLNPLENWPKSCLIFYWKDDIYKPIRFPRRFSMEGLTVVLTLMVSVVVALGLSAAGLQLLLSFLGNHEKPEK